MKKRNNEVAENPRCSTIMHSLSSLRTKDEIAVEREEEN